jgi:SOS response regulatory protein OraA/RecX
VEEKYISEALSHVPEDAYLKVLADLLSAKAKSVKDKDSYTRRNKLLTFAQSHGFESEEILKAIEQFKFLHL